MLSRDAITTAADHLGWTSQSRPHRDKSRTAVDERVPQSKRISGGDGISRVVSRKVSRRPLPEHEAPAAGAAAA
jgi:hypothetical protein